MSAPGKVKPARRRWWQLLARAAVVIALLAAALYVTLPWWMPSGVVGQYFADEMSRQMGVPVTVGEVSASWSDGLVLTDLQIHSDESFGGDVMVHVPEIRMDFSPLEMLFRERFDRMVLTGARMDARVDEDGNLNVAPLGRLEFDVVPDRVSIRQSVLTFAVPAGDHVLRFDIADLQINGGRIEDISRVTMSARLRQDGTDAPMSLNIGESILASAAATATLNFGNLDLAQLPLPEMLQLPLREMSGRCDGSIDLQLNRHGVVDRATVDFGFHDLSIQPRDGVELPVLESAELKLSSRLDPIRDVLEIESAQVNIPGLELTGRARLSTAFGGLSWDSVEELDFRTRLHPDRLTAMLGMRLPGELDVSGPVEIAARVRHRGVDVRVELRADATEAEVSRHDRLVKPAGRTLRAELSGLLSDRTWSFRSDTCELELGGNSVSGSLAVDDVRPILRSRTGKIAVSDMMELLEGISWRCRWTVANLQALTDLSPRIPRRRMHLDGEITGRLVLEKGDRPHLDGSIKVSAETDMRIGRWWSKPDGEEITLSYQGRLEPKHARLSEGLVTLAIGEGRLVAGDVTVNIGEEAQGLSASGRFYAASFEEILRCLRLPKELLVTGSVSGRGGIDASPDGVSATVFADFSGTDVRLGSWPVKPADEACSVSLRASAGGQLNANRWQISGDVRSAWATAAIEGGGISADKGEAGISLAIRDVVRLVERLPPLREALGNSRLTGAADTEMRLQWEGDSLGLNLTADATGLGYVSAAGERKAPGTLATLELSGGATQSGRGRWQATIDGCRIQFGTTRANITGEVRAEIPDASSLSRLSVGGVRVEARLESVLAADGPLRLLLPGLDRLAERYKLRGEAGIEATIRTSGESLEFDGRLDATNLSARYENFFGPDLPATLEHLGLVSGPAVKPAGVPAEVRLSGSTGFDLSRIQLRTLFAAIGGAELTGQAVLSRTGERTDYRLENAHAQVSVLQAETLEEILPSLKPWAVTGSVSAAADYSGADGGRIERLSLHMDRLAARIGEKPVLLDGAVRMESIRDLGGQLPAIRNVRSDKLEIRVGENHVWLVMDLSNLDTRPAGRVDLLCRYMDDLDLMRWLSPEQEPYQPDGELTADEASRLQDDARRWVLLARHYLASADLSLNVRARRMRTFDARVQEAYVVNNLRLEGAAENGRVRVEFVAGLDGGTYRRELEVDLTESAPSLASRTDMRDVIATESIQPQLALYFPGNTVHGEFNRTENLNILLRDMLAQQMDPRYPLGPLGRARTVTIDGVVIGRAAPKFVTRIFPGLNLARYEYRKMTSFTEFLPDGTAVNDMIFKGPLYDVYIEGTTDDENIGEYEIGLILLSTPQTAEWNHAYRQGRIPLLHFSARIEGGELHDTKVWYFWPNETLFTVFLKNNFFYRIWVEVRKDPDEELPRIE